jgi:hypothetical protein
MNTLHDLFPVAPTDFWGDYTRCGLIRRRDLPKKNNTFSIDMAMDRDQWRRIVEAAKDLNGPY